MRILSGCSIILLAALVVFTVDSEARSRNITVTPAANHYSFLVENETFKDIVPELYTKTSQTRGEVPLLNAIFTEPKDLKIKFHNGSEETIGAMVKKRKEESPQFFAFRKGVYPFSIFENRKDGNLFSGAMVVFNTTPEISLATFGASDETKLFDPAMLEKAKNGVLANYSISFDDNEVIVYWLGNRKNLYPGGDPNVEMDFSATKDIKEVKIDGKKQKDPSSIVLNVFGKKERVRGYDGRYMIDLLTGTYKIKTEAAVYELEMMLSGGIKYQGYIKNLKDNAFTAFVRVPCEIPEDLFIAANKGTISKFTVTSGEEEEGVAEIIF